MPYAAGRVAEPSEEASAGPVAEPGEEASAAALGEAVTGKPEGKGSTGRGGFAPSFSGSGRKAVGRLQVLPGLHLRNALPALDGQGRGIELHGLLSFILDVVDHPQAHIGPDPDTSVVFSRCPGKTPSYSQLIPKKDQDQHGERDASPLNSNTRQK